MEDLLQSQIHESCKLAMPVGLKELMSDISREVLRTQPENLYQFIADYLEALLITRETLAIACRICGEVSSCSCQPQLVDELTRIGLSHEDVEKAKNIILNHFDKGQVHEANLLVKIAAKTSVTEVQLLELQQAIQRSFQRYILKNKDMRVSFGKFDEGSMESTRTREDSANVSTVTSLSDFYKPTSVDDITVRQETQNKPFYTSPSTPPLKASVSATSLAGSHVDLPLRIPYSAHTSECQNMLIKSEKSVMNMLKSLLFAEDHAFHGVLGPMNSIGKQQTLGSTERLTADSEDIDYAIKSIFSQDISEVRSRTSRESRGQTMFRAIQEDLNETSSGSS